MRMSEGELARWRAAHVGFIFQFYNLMPMLTAAQNVELPLLLTQLSRRERREHVETALGDRRPGRPRQALSARDVGRPAAARRHRARHRVRPAAAALRRADRRPRSREPPTKSSRSCNCSTSELGKTIVMVTHDPMAAKYARRTLHLDKGRFIETLGSGVRSVNDFVLILKNLFRKKLRAVLMIFSILAGLRDLRSAGLRSSGRSTPARTAPRPTA